MRPRKSLYVNLFFIGFAFFTISAAQAQSPIQLADKIASDVFKKEKFPGMAVEVWKQGEEVFSKSYGYADIENETPIDPKTTLFRIGSVSKPFTAAGLAILYDQGTIDLDAPIQTYVPDFPKKEHDISLRQLTGHLAGIRHYRGMEFMSNVHYPTVSEGLDIFKSDDLINVPGTKYSYSSYGWNLISAAMETIAEEDFLSFMLREVFEALNMIHTLAEDNTVEIPNKVTYYSKAPNGDNIIAPTVDNSYKWAGGGFLSSVHNLCKFGQAHLDAEFVSSETIKLWTTSQTTTDGKETNYGIGWRSAEDKKSRHWFGHSGGSVGGTTMLLVYPEEEVIVALTINQSSAKYGNLAFRIAEQFLN